MLGAACWWVSYSCNLGLEYPRIIPSRLLNSAEIFITSMGSWGRRPGFNPCFVLCLTRVCSTSLPWLLPASCLYPRTGLCRGQEGQGQEGSGAEACSRHSTQQGSGWRCWLPQQDQRVRVPHSLMASDPLTADVKWMSLLGDQSRRGCTKASQQSKLQGERAWC